MSDKSERCVCCGREIPEGRQVCPICEAKTIGNDLVRRKELIAAYDAAHKGPPGGARKLMEEAPTVDAIPIEWLESLMLNGDREHSVAAWRVLNAWHPRDEGAWRKAGTAKNKVPQGGT